MSRPHLPAVFVSSSGILWGAETSLLTTAHHLADHGIEVGLLARSAELVEQWPGAAKRQASGATFYLRLLQVALRDRPEALICCSNRLSLAFVPLRVVPKQWRPRLIFDLHDYMPARHGRRRMRRSTWFFDHVIAVSRFTTTQIHPWYTSITVLPRPVDDVGVLVEPPARSRVGVVGRLDADKQLEVVVEAMKLLPDDVSLVLRGSAGRDTGYSERFLAAAAEALGPRLEHEGRVPREHAMDDLSCLVVTNHKEALGRSVAEAQLAGVPVVVPDHGGATEMVEDGVTGRHFQTGSAASLADALRSLLGDPGSTVAMADKARAAATERHSPDAIALRYLEAATGKVWAQPVRRTISLLATRIPGLSTTQPSH